MITTVTRIRIGLLRLRHSMAVADLHWMTQRANECITAQRERCQQLESELLTAEIGTSLSLSADTIRHGVERRSKWGDVA